MPETKRSRWGTYGRRVLAGWLVAGLVLGGVEAGLRAAHVRDPVPFFLRRTDALGREWAMTNPEAAADWFPGPEWDENVRHPRAQIFPVAKPPNALRVFVFGESSAYGTPFNDNASWPRLLEQRLRTDLAGSGANARRVEVVNCGVRASTLSLATPVIDEIRSFSPDLFVVYAGHNEFYGPRLPSALERLRLFKLLRGAEPPAAPGAAPKVIGIRAEFSVDPADPLRAIATARFKDSLASFFAAAAPTPVVVVPTWANERDLAPLGSYTGQAAPADVERANALVKQVEDDPTRATAEAAGTASDLLARMPEHAGLEHVLGLAALLAGDVPGARDHFGRAMDLDTVPIRASTAMRQALTDAVAAADPARVTACDPGPTFRAATADGAFDHRLFLDHVHLTLHAGYLLAGVLERCIADREHLALVPAAGEPDAESALRLQLGIHPVDEVSVANNMGHYFHKATVQASPSRDRSVAYYQRLASELSAQVPPDELRVLDGSPADLHLRIAQSLAAQGAPAADVLSEVRAGVLANPGSGPAHAWLAELLLAQNAPDARDEAVLALLLGVPARRGQAIARAFGLPEHAGTDYAVERAP